MAALDFPTAPTDGDIYENWQYNGTLSVWELIAVPEPSPTSTVGFRQTFLMMGA